MLSIVFSGKECQFALPATSVLYACNRFLLHKLNLSSHLICGYTQFHGRFYTVLSGRHLFDCKEGKIATLVFLQGVSLALLLKDVTVKAVPQGAPQPDLPPFCEAGSKNICFISQPLKLEKEVHHAIHRL